MIDILRNGQMRERQIIGAKKKKWKRKKEKNAQPMWQGNSVNFRDTASQTE